MFDLSDYLPRARNWFVEDVVYEGTGRAEFRDPYGWVEGHVRIEYDVIGQARIQMKISVFHNEYNPDGNFACEQLLSGKKPENRYLNKWELNVFNGKQKNECTSFVVTADNFTFVAIGIIDFRIALPSLSITGIVQFFCSKSEVIIHNAQKPKYWVMPLCNFVSNYGLRFSDLNPHPLRQYSFPPIPDGLTDEHRCAAEINQRSFNALIRFRINDRYGYIEALPDYPTKKENLVSGNLPYAITAIMNCEIGNDAIDINNLKSWIPFRFLSLLSLITGSRVSTPWIELRDENGHLVSRIHTPQWARRYLDGHAILDDNIHHGIGQFLTTSVMSEHFNSNFVYDVIEQLILSTQAVTLSLGDRLVPLCRAIDTLCEEHGLYETIKLKSFLDSTREKIVVDSIERTISEIKAIAEELKKEGKHYESKRLDRVITALRQSQSIRLGFAKAVDALLQKYDLPDARIMDEYYAQYPYRKNGKDKLKGWARVLEHLRGKFVHHMSYFDEEKEDWKHVEQFILHLHDILIRIIFKMLNYTGYYQPIISEFLINKHDANWVKADTPPSKLGYKHRKQTPG